MAGETDTETDDIDFAERERQAAEDRAFELNPFGTGVDPDMDLNYDYDYETSPELTDADYQPNNSFSDDFTNYGGADPYASQFGQDDEAAEDEDDENDNASHDEDYGDEQEDWDGDDDEIAYWEGDDDEDWSDKEDDEAGRKEDDKDGNGQDKTDREQTKPLTRQEKREAQKKEKQAQARKQEQSSMRHGYYNNLKVKWIKGDPVNLQTLSYVWGQCRKINQVRPLMDEVNRALDGALLESGPNLMIKFNKYLHTINTQEDDMMGSLLDLANSGGKRLALTTGAVVEAIFDQQWLQPVMMATVPATLSGIIASQPMQSILQKLFEKAVPIINGMAKDQAKSAKTNL